MLFALLSLTLPSFAAEAPEAAQGLGKGVRVVVTETVDAAPEVVWDLFADFAAIDTWSSGIDASRPMTPAEMPEGYAVDPDAPVMGRIVTTNGRDQSHILVNYDADATTLTFRSGDLPKVLRYAQNTHTIEALSNGRTRVTVDVYLVPAGVAKLFRGKLERKFTGYMVDYLAEAKHHLERSPAVAQSRDR